GRLRDQPIWLKLGFIMVVPTIATIVVGTAGLFDNVSRASEADRARTLAGLSADAAVLVHALQNERGGGALLMPSKEHQNLRGTFDKYAQATDDATKKYKQSRTGLTDAGEDLGKRLDSIDHQLTDLPALRRQVISATDLPMSTALTSYRALISD